MNSVIKVDSDSYNEMTADEDRNWAAAYAKREMQKHKETTPIDHPDGSVTEEKLSAALREKISSGSEQTKKDVAELKAKAATTEKSIKETSDAVKAEKAERQAETAELKAENEKRKSDTAQLKTDTAQLKTDTERIEKELKAIGTGTGTITDGSITAAKLATGSVTTAKIADKAITRTHFSNELERQAANWDVAYSNLDLVMGNIGSIDTALDEIMHIQNQLISGVFV